MVGINKNNSLFYKSEKKHGIGKQSAVEQNNTKLKETKYDSDVILFLYSLFNRI
jgi:hypothetical protein